MFGKKETKEPEEKKELEVKQEESSGPHEKFADSADLCEQARDGRNISDIPLGDPYWDVVNRHTANHGRHAVRVDDLPEAKKTKELEAKGVVVDK